MRILCVHQGYELYGSDRCFAESVAAIRKAYPEAEIEVVLSRAGPIVGLLEANASRIVYEPIWVLRRRNLVRLATIDLLRLPKAIVKAAARMRRSDLVYINTCVVADYILAARFFKRSTLVHVHEIQRVWLCAFFAQFFHGVGRRLFSTPKQRRQRSNCLKHLGAALFTTVCLARSQQSQATTMVIVVSDC
jgi:hypothetical protein